MILLVNLNLAVDYLVEVDALQPGGVQRSQSARRQAGGKGVNVARVLKTLGEESLLMGFLGGQAGDLIAEGLRAEGLASRCTPIQGESRTCLILHDRSRREQTVINDPGPAISDAKFREFTAGYERAISDAALVVITGSLPPNLPADTYAQLIDAAQAGGQRTLLDCAGTPLRLALEARPFLVKINATEAAELVGEAVPDFAAAARAARKMREMGAAVGAMITLGALGALLDFEDARYIFAAPRLATQSSVGSGDAAMAGLAAGTSRGWTAARTGAFAVAAGAANALHGAGQCSAEEIFALQPRVTFTRSVVEELNRREK